MLLIATMKIVIKRLRKENHMKEKSYKGLKKIIEIQSIIVWLWKAKSSILRSYFRNYVQEMDKFDEQKRQLREGNHTSVA